MEKAMLVREVLIQCPDTILVSGNGMAGYSDANEIKTKRTMRRLYVCGDQRTDVGDSIGLMTPRVAICAGHQTNKVIELIVANEYATLVIAKLHFAKSEKPLTNPL